MGLRILNLTACCFVAVWPITVHGQSPDAQTVTQAILDQHKSADPTNSARALTGKSHEFDISKIPHPSGQSSKATRTSPQTSQRIRELKEKKKNFFNRAESQSTETTFVQASPGTSPAPDYDTRVLPTDTMRSASSSASMERSQAAFNATKAHRKGNQDREKTLERKWEESPDGKTLRRLEEASRAKQKAEFDISDVPLPRSNPK